MHVSFSHEMLAITIQDDANTFYHLQNIIEKNFSKRIGRKNKTIVFKEEHEEVQRRYFLKLLGKIYKRLNKTPDEKTINDIKNSLDKSIKISHLQTNQIQPQLNISMKIEDNYAIVFHIDGKNSILVSYLKNYFKDHLVKYRLKDNTITVYTNSQKTPVLLEKLLGQTEVIGSYVDFHYDISQFLEFKKTFAQRIKRKQKFNALFSLLEEYYEVLECKAEDTFETIRKQYLKLVKQYHPDTIGYSDPSLVSQYAQKFQSVKHAYEMIKVHFDHEKTA